MNGGRELLYISEAETVRMDLRMGKIIPFAERVLEKGIAGRAHAAPRTRLIDPPIAKTREASQGRPWERDLRVLPGYVEGMGFGVRLGASQQRSTSGGALLILFDWETMVPSAIISDWLVHGIRSTLPDGIAARHLAREDAHTLGLLGSGRLARWAAEAVMAVRPITTVRVYSPNREHREECASYLAARNPGVSVSAPDHPREVCEGAQVVIGAASSRDSLIEGSWLERGALVISNEPEDFDASVIERASRLYTTWLPGIVGHVPSYKGVDDVLDRTGSTYEDSVIDVSRVIVGEAPARQDDDEILAFLNPAYPIFDVACAAYVHERALELGMGVELELPNKADRVPSWGI